MPTTTPLGIPYPVIGDSLLIAQHFASLAAYVDALLTLPSDAQAYGGGANIVASIGSYAVLPTNPCSVAITNPRSDHGLLCQVNFAAWMTANGAETRASINATGANAWTAGTVGPGGTAGPNGNSENILVLSTQTTGAWFEMHAAFTMVVPASGTTTLETRGFKSAAGTQCTVDFPTIRITPLRYV